MKEQNNFKNNLLKRKEIELILSKESNPGFDEVRKELAEKFKVAEDVIAVKLIKGGFGKNEFNVKAFIYDSVKDREGTERKPKAKKNAEGGVPAVQQGAKK